MPSDRVNKLKIAEVATSINIQTQEIARSSGRVPSQIFWWSWLLLSAVVFIYQSLTDVFFYLSQPTTIEEFELFHETLSFPDVSFCAPLAISHKMEKKLNISTREEMMHFLSAFVISPPLLDHIKEDEWGKFEYHFKFMKDKLGVQSWDWFHTSLNLFHRGDVIKSCTIRGVPIPCNTGINRFPPFLMGTDTCFLIFLKAGQNQTLAGPRGAFRATISKAPFTKKYLHTDSLGWNVWFSELLDLSRVGDVSAKVIPEGQYVEIKTTIRMQKRLNRPSSPCIEPGDISTPELGCQAACELSKTVDHCGCYRGGLSAFIQYQPGAKAHMPCEIGRETFCAYNATRSMTSCKCGKLLCDSVQSSAEISIRGSLQDRNLTEVAIFHDRLREVHKVEFPAVTISNLVGTVGGQASILLGLRAANFVQLLFYTFVWLWYKFAEYRRLKTEGEKSGEA